MLAPVYNLAGEVVKNIEISDLVFAVPFNEAVVHQVMVSQRANARHGTADTKTRAEVAGSTKKLFRQKGTGSARAGSQKSPLRRGGGVIFGPHPRSYRQATPRKMRRLAIKCVMSAKAGGGALKIVEDMKFEEPKTKKMKQALAALGASSSVLIVTAAPEENVIKSARNLPGTKTLPASILNVVDMLSYKMLFITEEAVRKVERLWKDGATKGGSDASLRGAETSGNN